MSDVFSRFFGKNPKKVSQSPSQSSSDPTFDHVATAGEDDGFTLISGGGGNSGNSQNWDAVLPPSDSSPNMLVPPYPPNPAAAPVTCATQSMSVHGLDGVPFVLSVKCQFAGNKGRRGQADTLLEDVSVRLATVQQLIQSADYDFRLERSVIESEISGTMRRMQTY